LASSEGSLSRQTWHYHFLEGHMLVDLKSLGQIPAEHRSNATLRMLFGEQNVLMYPSELPGMSYKVAYPKDNYQVHIGFRNGVLFVRAKHLYTKKTYELVPDYVFGGKGKVFDLPATLIHNCCHWCVLSSSALS